MLKFCLTLCEIEIQSWQTDKRSRHLTGVQRSVVIPWHVRLTPFFEIIASCIVVAVKHLRVIALCRWTLGVNYQRLSIANQWWVFISVKWKPCIKTRLAFVIEFDYILTSIISCRPEPFGVRNLVVILRKNTVTCVEVFCGVEQWSHSAYATTVTATIQRQYVMRIRVRLPEYIWIRIGDYAPHNLAVAFGLHSVHGISHFHNLFLELIVGAGDVGQRDILRHTLHFGGFECIEWAVACSQSRSNGFFTSGACTFPLVTAVRCADKFGAITRSFVICVTPIRIGERAVP